MRRLVLAIASALAAWPLAAQQPVVTQQSWVATSNASGTVAVTNTFQSVFPATSAGARVRQGCLIQNLGTNTMYVFFGPVASATLLNSIQLTTRQFCSCTVGGATLQDQVSITGTATEGFYAAQQ